MTAGLEGVDLVTGFRVGVDIVLFLLGVAGLDPAGVAGLDLVGVGGLPTGG